MHQRVGTWVAAGLLVAAGLGCGGADSPPGEGDPGAESGEAPAAAPAPDPTTLQGLRDQEDRDDETIWAPEIRSESFRETFVQLWDQIHAAEDPWSVLIGANLGTIDPGRLGEPEDLGSGIVVREITSGSAGAAGAGGATRDAGSDPTAGASDSGGMDAAARKAWIETAASRFDLHYLEILPRRFVDETPARSVYAVTVHLLPRAGSGETRRVQIEADVEVVWSGEQDAYLNAIPGSIRVLGGTWLERPGPPVFREALLEEIPGHQPIPPIAVHDVDGDGWSDIAYPQTNTLLRNAGGFEFERSDLCSFPLANYYDAIFGDFDGDGALDFLAAGIGEGDSGNRPSLYLFEKGGSGAFTEPPLKVYGATFGTQLSFAAGDIDDDGDLDLYVCKYLPPFIAGQVPTPFHDANDGVPADLLLNDGSGRFTQGIEGSGLETERFRRTFRVSFVDLDEDGDLDLLQTNDFHGTAIFWNDGKGHFTAAENGGVDEPANFGMSHAFGDFNRDGRLDFYVTGMYSYTVRRLVDMGLGRPDRPDVDDHREAMSYGNRMYLGQEEGPFREPPYRDTVANSGWSWGVCAFDVDGDTDMDLFIANGHITGPSIRDIDSRYWRHDVYRTGSDPDPVKNAHFLDKMSGLGRTESWAGYEHNRLFLNRGEAGFLSVGHLFGVADDIDSRHVIAEDFDQDGRPDLLVGFKSRVEDKKGFRVYRNGWPDPGPWIGVRLEGAPGRSPLGARILVVTDRGSVVLPVVVGDSFFSQGSDARHFGLEPGERVLRIEVTWPGGVLTTLEAPEPGRYHRVEAPAR